MDIVVLVFCCLVFPVVNVIVGKRVERDRLGTNGFDVVGIVGANVVAFSWRGHD